jgi:hypothetical protein
MKKQIYFFSIFFVFLFLITSAKAQEYGEFWSLEYFWTQVFGLPAEWLPTKSIRDFIFNFMVPFLALFTILLGILRQIRIFWRTPAIEIVIAFAMAFLTLPSKIFIILVSLTLAFAGIWGYLMFLFMFIGGSLFYSLYFVRRWRGRADIYKHFRSSMTHLSNEEKILSEQIADLYQQLSQAKDPKEMDRINKKIKALKERLDFVREKMRSLRLSHEVY